MTAFAETTAKSTNFEKTTLVEFVNNDTVEVNTVRLWLGTDSGTFKSFKTEKGWTGLKTPQGVLVFSSVSPLGPGESVKFGIKTEIENPGVNWKSLDVSGNEITIGKVVAGQASKATPAPTDNGQKPVTNLESAIFRIIPDKPKNGDSVRVVGYGFPPNKHLDFLINDEKLEDFQTDSSGHLIGRTKIPITTVEERYDFSLADEQGEKKTISIRIEHRDEQMSNPKSKHLTVDQIIQVVEPGQTASASGTGQPGSAVTISAQDASGNKIYEAVVEVNGQGLWSHETTISPDAELGSRIVTFSDGIDTIEKTISVSVSKTIHIKSSAVRYESGEKMLFNGTAVANQSVEVVIKDPIGKEIFSDVLKIGESGAVNFEYQTSATSAKGTYVVLFTQEDETEILRIGLGQLPTEQIVAKFDHLNYATTEKPKLTLQGPAKATVSLLIIDPSDKAKLSDSVTLGLDGRNVYEIDLANYKSGVYSVVIKYTQFQTTEVFSVGLQQSSGPIQIQSTKQTYQHGDSVIILGSTNANILLSLEMSDPDGQVIKHKDLFTDKAGKFFDGTFRIPSDANPGTWIIKASSGPNYAEAKLTVAGTIAQGFVIKVDKTTPYQIGDFMKISGTGGGKTQTAAATILTSGDVEVVDLSTFSTSEGSFEITWKIPPEIVPGSYKIQAKVGSDVAETTFSVQ
ncbi:MAG: biofilm-associated protein [Nitrososphaerota archaeon]